MLKEKEELTSSQKSIWVIEQYYKGSSINNICGTAIIEEQIDFEKLKKSIEIVCEKHDNFKLKIKIEEGEVKQVLSKEKNEVETVNVEGKKQLEEERNKIVRTPLEITNSLLYKFYIFKFKNGEGAFMLNIHHLISDAWTLAFICNEIIKTYSLLKQNQKIENETIYSYIDYINSEKEYLKSDKFQKDKLYWNEKFQTIPEIATIPGNKINNQETNSAEGKRIQFEIEKEKVLEIKEYCKENNITIYNFLMAIFSIYISEITNLDEFVIGTPILNRANYREKKAAGMFINMAPLKINLEGIESFKELTKSIAMDSLKMLKHQKYSYQYLLEDLREKNKSIPNLYNILLSYQVTNAQMSGENIKYKTEWTFNGCCAENLDIQVYDINDTGNLNIAYDYKVEIYEAEDIKNLHKRIMNIISQIIKSKDIEIKDIEIVTPEEKQKLLVEFNKTELEYNEEISIIKYFEKQAKEKPNNIAVVFENKKMTYKELNEKANSLAFELRKNGVTNNTIVGIMKERSFEMMIAILAVLKSGGGYIPIAPDYPNERIQYMLEDSKAKILLIGKNGKDRINTNQKKIIIDLDNNKIYNRNIENKENISNPEDLSYLIYTSGSTGKPKGVMLNQKNLTNFYNAMKKEIKYLKDKKEHKIISITTLSFDIFIFETLISLTRGLTLYITNEKEQKIASELEQLIKENEIEIIQTTPSVMKFHLENISNYENIASLKYVVLAGEQLPNSLVGKLKEKIPGVTIYNGYGPSETTIFSTIKDVTDLEKVTIGKPIANTQIYILNKNKKLLPQGTIGEIYISGDGVGKGYMNKKEQTEKNFIKNPFKKDKIMYKAGDLGSFDKNGEITCYGRIDNQIKINGLRIELGEIEETINSFKSDHLLKSAVIIKKVDNKNLLNAFISYPTKLNNQKLKKYLLSKLPSYMQPNSIIYIEKLPLTPNGKIDRKSLQNYKIETEEEKIEYISPRNETEKLLVEVIKEKLEVEEFGIDNNIFDFGADSLIIINIITELFRYDYNLKVIDIYKNPTVKEIYENVLQNEEYKEDLLHPEYIELNKKVEQFSKEIDCKEIKNKYNILLTGATGFFGNHLLIELLNNIEQIGKIYCIIREKKDITPVDRLTKKVNFYFGKEYNELFEKYVEVVEGDISEDKLGLDMNTYKKLQDSVDIVIHSAANVKHYENYLKLKKANIMATQNIIDFCKNSKIKLHYISTMTVSGNYLIKQNNNNVVFGENSFYVGQNFEDNVYSKSKLIAESLVLESMSKELTATIYRLGDLTGRYSDGVFQENINCNATYLRLKSILEIGAIPENILNNNLEFSPVDSVVKAVRKIIWSDKCENRIFNIYNPKLLLTSELIKFIEKDNYSIETVTKEEFNKLIERLSSNKESQKRLIGIINDFTDNKDLIYNYTIRQENKISCDYLKNLNFNWKEINEEYINKLIQYMKRVKFID